MESREALKALFAPLRFRPLLWMGLAAILGVSLASPWVRLCGASDREALSLWYPILPIPIAIFFGWRWRERAFAWRACCFIGIISCFLPYAGRRILPPRDDISALVRGPYDVLSPLQSQTMTVTGTVADFPARGDFAIQFPLNCLTPKPGLVWVTAPYDTRAEVGNEVRASLELRPLLTPGNPGEHASQWPLIVLSLIHI